MPQTLHVALNGSDGGLGTVGSPLKTINYAGGLLAPGDTCIIHAGNYDECLNNPAWAGTNWSLPIRFTAAPGESVWLAPSVGNHPDTNYVVSFYTNQKYLEFDGINIRGVTAATATIGNAGDPPDPGIPSGPLAIQAASTRQCGYIRWKNATWIVGAKGPTASESGNAGVSNYTDTSDPTSLYGGHNEFINLDVTSAASTAGGRFLESWYGFYIATSNNLIDGCRVHNNDGQCMTVFNSFGIPCADNIIRNSFLYDITRTGSSSAGGGSHICAAFTDTGLRTLFYNNVIYGITLGFNATQAYGVVSYYSTNCLYYNNTIVGIPGPGLYTTGGSGATVKNNIVWGNSQDIVDDTGSTTASNNFQTADGDPLFSNAGAHDYTLRSTSPCINTGATIAAVPTDILGAARPAGAYDKGAYEFGGSAPAAIQLVTRDAGSGNASSTSATMSTPPSAVTAGNLLVAYVYWDDPATTSTSVVDTAGNTFVNKIRLHTVGANVLEIWEAYQCLGHAANVITATADVATVYRAIRQEQYQGLGTADPFEDSDSGSGVGAAGLLSLSTPALTAAASASVIVFFGAGFTAANAWTPKAGYNLSSWAITGDAIDYFFTAYRVVTAGEAPTATHPTAGAEPWFAVSAAFGVTTGGGGTSTLASLQRGRMRASRRGSARGH